MTALGIEYRPEGLKRKPDLFHENLRGDSRKNEEHYENTIRSR